MNATPLFNDYDKDFQSTLITLPLNRPRHMPKSIIFTIVEEAKFIFGPSMLK